MKHLPSKQIIFICSPLAGDIEGNMQRARHYCRFAVSKGAIPFAPHLLFPQFLFETVHSERDMGISFGLAFMKACAGLWVFGKSASRGMRIELAFARKQELPIKFFNEKCVEVAPFV